MFFLVIFYSYWWLSLSEASFTRYIQVPCLVGGDWNQTTKQNWKIPSHKWRFRSLGKSSISMGHFPIILGRREWNNIPTDELTPSFL